MIQNSAQGCQAVALKQPSLNLEATIMPVTKMAISKDTLSVIPACRESFFNNPLYPPFLRGTKKDSGQARMTTCIGNVVLLMADLVNY
ncbi:MAG: hypothetical protein COV68_04420 [Nitrospirae bacterium CG11_big_fil_rev_8_21_14_0_20_41_14]|nr:MAG: hypothetical protein COV68_04420 [Nitrospirae bacterium CG11_big_fil_rev_8_21_14_0_20_41_14]